MKADANAEFSRLLAKTSGRQIQNNGLEKHGQGPGTESGDQQTIILGPNTESAKIRGHDKIKTQNIKTWNKTLVISNKSEAHVLK